MYEKYVFFLVIREKVYIFAPAFEREAVEHIEMLEKGMVERIQRCTQYLTLQGVRERERISLNDSNNHLSDFFIKKNF